MSDPDDPSRWQAEDVISRGFKHDPEFVKLVENTAAVDDLDVDRYDATSSRVGRARCSRSSGRRTCMPSSPSSTRRASRRPPCATGPPSCAMPGCPPVNRWSAGKTVTGFANIEEDFSDQAVWESGALDRSKHVMPWRIEDELKKLGANYIQAGLWKGYAVRDGNLITGQQNFSGAEYGRGHRSPRPLADGCEHPGLRQPACARPAARAASAANGLRVGAIRSLGRVQAV